jgi:hypothetical protein
MAILASIQIQEMLKFLLKFGKMIDYLVYDMLSGQFLNYSTKKDENCPICGSIEVNDSNKIDKKVTQKDLDNMITKLKQ